MITVLVKYKQEVDGVRPDLYTIEERSLVLEVERLTDLNDIFRTIVDVKILSNN